MKTVVALAVALGAALLLIWFVLPSPGSTSLDRVDAQKILNASKAYAASLKAEGKPVPQTVSLDALISKGLLSSNDVTGFRNMLVTVTLTPNTNNPEDVLIRAKMADGREIAALADGSVQELLKR